MKKYFLLLLCVLFVFSVSSQNLNAFIKPFSLSIGGGVVTDDSFSFKPFLWTAGVNVDLSFGSLMLSPECFIIVNEFDFGAFWLTPAVVLNVKLANFFVGAGVTKWVLIGSDVDEPLSTDLRLKVNAGVKGMGLRIAGFLVSDFDDLFKKPMTVGATLSFGF